MRKRNTPTDADVYFSAIENDVRTNVSSSWLEVFCQRAMTGMFSYSVKNVATALYQFPQATEIAGEKTYQENRASVLDGAFPIRILSPSQASDGQSTKKFTWVTVYDVSQTTANPKKRYVVDEKTQLKKMYRWAKQAGFVVEYTTVSLPTPKVVQGDHIYLQVGISDAIASELICQELAKAAFVAKEKIEPTLVTALAAIASYCVSVNCGLPVPNLSQANKLTACIGDGLLANTEKSVKMARRICRALRKC